MTYTKEERARDNEKHSEYTKRVLMEAANIAPPMHDFQLTDLFKECIKHVLPWVSTREIKTIRDGTIAQAIDATKEHINKKYGSENEYRALLRWWGYHQWMGYAAPVAVGNKLILNAKQNTMSLWLDQFIYVYDYVVHGIEHDDLGAIHEEIGYTDGHPNKAKLYTLGDEVDTPRFFVRSFKNGRVDLTIKEPAGATHAQEFVEAYNRMEQYLKLHQLNKYS